MMFPSLSLISRGLRLRISGFAGIVAAGVFASFPSLLFTAVSVALLLLEVMFLSLSFGGVQDGAFGWY